MADGGLRLHVDTQEIENEDKALLMDLYNKLGIFVFSEVNILPEDMIELPEVKVEKGEKTPGQRLRGTLYRLWEQATTTKSSEEFYRDYVNRVIDNIKEELN